MDLLPGAAGFRWAVYSVLAGFTLGVGWLLARLEWSQLGFLALFCVFYLPHDSLGTLSWQWQGSDTQLGTDPL